ncbi:MAG TPA: Gfo/Idh/MocA family oxidoreductase [Tepidisphaeraceae bacterium]|jgi:predicted dehydrogenase|nr:Gfo/Idh/MocA family oxidoreductase [Tepidisphaeraceae bacterium]
MNRRNFLKTTAAAGFGVWVSSRALGQEEKSPAEKLNVAVVGVQGQGKSNLKGVKHQNIVALCDVDEKNIAGVVKEFPDLEKANRYADWRKMLEQKDIDAVVISIPDHVHAHATIASLQMGKHVYCEKPLTHSVYECRKVMETARRMKKATQMGTQIHAVDNYRRVVELLQSGAIGTVKRIHVWVEGGFAGGERPKDTPPVPPNINWDLWIGPAPYRPYHPKYMPFAWRGWWDFGGGKLADMACHHMDLSHWAFNLRYPETIESEGPPVHAESCPIWQIVHFKYAADGDRPPIHLTWYHGDKKPAEFKEKNLPKWDNGSLFVGDKGMLLADYGNHKLWPEADFKDFKRPPQTIAKSIGHHNEWIKGCKEGTPTTCNFEYSGALAETVLLGNVAYKAGKKISWDPMKGTTGDSEADQFLKREYRKGWEL